jgi:hypothetical protein
LWGNILPLIKENKVVTLAIYTNSTRRVKGSPYTASIFPFLIFREAIYHGDAVSKRLATETRKLTSSGRYGFNITVGISYLAASFSISHIAMN